MNAGTKHQAYTVLGQALSSLTNFVPAIYAAHVLTPTQFGVFGLIQLAYILGLGALRSSFTEVAIFTEATDEPTARHLGSVDAVLWAAVIAAGAGVSVVLLAVDAPWIAVVLTGLGMVVAVTQDAVRLVSISVGDGRAMAINDALWLLATIAALAGIAAVADPSPWVIAAGWTLAAAPGLMYGLVTTGWRPRIGRARWFVRDHPALSWALLSDWSIATAAAQAAIYGFGLVGGLVAVAQIRAAQLLLGPLYFAFTGAQFAATRSVMLRKRGSLPAMRRLLAGVSVGLGLTSLLAGGVLLLVPESWLALVVGEQAGRVKGYVLPIAVGVAATGFATGGAIGLRALHAGRALSRTRLQGSATMLAGGGVGYLTTGTTLGGLWGLAVGGLIAVALWHRGFSAAYREALLSRAETG